MAFAGLTASDLGSENQLDSQGRIPTGSTMPRCGSSPNAHGWLFIVFYRPLHSAVPCAGSFTACSIGLLGVVDGCVCRSQKQCIFAHVCFKLQFGDVGLAPVTPFGAGCLLFAFL